MLFLRERRSEVIVQGVKRNSRLVFVEIVNIQMVQINNEKSTRDTVIRKKKEGVK